METSGMGSYDSLWGDQKEIAWCTQR